jgi:hypothetical protein
MSVRSYKIHGRSRRIKGWYAEPAELVTLLKGIAMEELFSRLNSSDAVGVVFFTLAFAAGIVVWLSMQWRMHRRTEMEVALKQLMLERGMSAAEIERVLHARLGEGADPQRQNAVPRLDRRVGSLR